MKVWAGCRRSSWKTWGSSPEVDAKTLGHGLSHNPPMSVNTNKPRVVIIGCGFGGLEAARALARAPVEVTLVDRTNHHLFQPLLYQVATAGLSAPAISAPIRHVLRREMRRGNLTILQAEATDVDVVRREVVLARDGD